MNNYIDPDTNAPDVDRFAADLRARFARKQNLSDTHRTELAEDDRPVVLYTLGTEHRMTGS